MKNTRQLLTGAGLALALVLLVGATAKTIYRGTFQGDGSGLTGVTATASGGVATSLTSGSTVTNVTVYGSTARTNWTTVASAGLLSTNTDTGFVRLSSGRVQLGTNHISARMEPVAGAGFLVASNNALYWVTTAKTNLISAGE